MVKGAIVIVKNPKSRWYNYVGKVIDLIDKTCFVNISNTIEEFNVEDLEIWN